MTLVEFLLCAVLIAVSAYVAASEIAIFSLSRFQLRSLKERNPSAHRRIKRLLNDPGGLLITTLVINEILNISLSNLITQAVARTDKNLPLFITGLVPGWTVDTVVGILVTTPIVLFVCEITPKVIAARANQLVATLTNKSLTVTYDLFWPVRKGLTRLVRLLAPSKAGAGKEGGEVLKESDFLAMIEEGHREGAIHEDELELIKNVFEFDDTTVAEVYTPLSQVQTLSVNTTLRGALTAIRSQKYSRIPIVSGKNKDVVGILYSKDLLRAKLETERMGMTVAEIMRKPLMVNSTLRLNSVFRVLKQHKTHMAVVTADGPVGIITMHDIMDALFEDVFADKDDDSEFRRLDGSLRRPEGSLP